MSQNVMETEKQKSRYVIEDSTLERLTVYNKRPIIRGLDKVVNQVLDDNVQLKKTIAELAHTD